MAQKPGPEMLRLAQRLQRYDGPPVSIMEVCGTQTAENYRQGIRSLLPAGIRLIAGPGCPVCVTPAGFIDAGAALSLQKGTLVCTFGDLIRVPGIHTSLAEARSQGGAVRPVYSPFDAVKAASENPHLQVVFLAVGFETTAPAVCLAVKQAAAQGLSNFSVLSACKTMTNAYYRLAGSAQAFLYPGHVSAITGMGVYRRLARDGISGVVSGFSAPELLTALTVLVEKLREGEPFAVNCYTRVVPEEGSPRALSLLDEVMEACGAVWRGLGEVPGSGLRLKSKYAAFDAAARFSVPPAADQTPPGCRCAEVLTGGCEPADCPLFAKVCTPQSPVGACMVSGEGACAACYRFVGLTWMQS